MKYDKDYGMLVEKRRDSKRNGKLIDVILNKIARIFEKILS